MVCNTVHTAGGLQSAAWRTRNTVNGNAVYGKNAVNGNSVNGMWSNGSCSGAVCMAI